MRGTVSRVFVCVPVAIATISLPLALLLELLLLPVVVVVRACACQSQRHSSHPSHYIDTFVQQTTAELDKRTNVYTFITISIRIKPKDCSICCCGCQWFCCCVGFVFISIYGIAVRIVCLAK